MPALEFPRRHVDSLVQLGARLLDSRKPKTDNGAFARELLVGFHDVCMRAGLDRVLAELEQAQPPLDITDRTALADHPVYFAAMVAQLAALDLDGGGPRNARQRQLADALLAAFALTPADEPDRAIALDDKVRGEVSVALAGAIDHELAIPHMRDTIVARARERCEPRYHAAFDKLAPHLDERGLRILKQPKLPLDAVQHVQRALAEAASELFDRIVRAAVDRARDVLARASAEVAARIDQPVTHRLTPREGAILRATDARVPKTPERVVESVLDSLTELCRIAWRAPEKPVRTYGASQTFAVGDLIEHPKFGRGTVISALPQRIEVEFADGKHTLVHVGLRR
jgi:hypothetical protein